MADSTIGNLTRIEAIKAIKKNAVVPTEAENGNFCVELKGFSLNTPQMVHFGLKADETEDGKYYYELKKNVSGKILSYWGTEGTIQKISFKVNDSLINEDGVYFCCVYSIIIPILSNMEGVEISVESQEGSSILECGKPSEFVVGNTYEIRVMLNNVVYTEFSRAIPSPSSGEVTIGDKTYPTVTINGREWMAENLDYNIEHEDTPALNPSLGFRWYDTDTETMYNESYVEGLKFGKYYAPAVALYWDIYRRGSAELRAGIPAMYRNFFDSVPEGWRLPTIEDFASLGFPYEEEETLNPSLCVDQSECKWGVNFKPTNSSGLSLVPSSYMHLRVIGSQNIHLVEDNAKKSTLEGVTDGYFNTTLAGELRIDDIDNFNPSTVTGAYIVGSAYVYDEEDENFRGSVCFDDCYSYDDVTHTLVKPVGEAFLEWLEKADWNVIRLVRDAQ